MSNEHRRPAGVDPSVLERSTTIEAQAQAIGRRVAAKAVALATLDATSEPSGVTAAERAIVVERLELADLVEAEIRSAGGTPSEGSVVLRLQWGEALTLAAAVVEAQSSDRSATELSILAKMREKIFEALGIAPSC